MNYEDRYKCGLPHHRRVYFDWIGDEFKSVSKERKLLDLGYLNSVGYDLRSEIHATYKEHNSVNEDNVRYSLLILLAELWGSKIANVEYMYRHLTLDKIIDLLLYNLTLYYHRPSDPYKKHYLKAPVDITLAELAKENPWEEVSAMYERNTFLLADSNKQLACKADIPILEDFNSAAKDEYKYVLNVPAYPWLGNPLTANVIILSLNPGYVERESKMAKLLQSLPERETEGYCEFLRKTLTLDAHALLPNDGDFNRLSDRDLANMHGGWYWWDKLHNAFIDNGPKLNVEAVLKHIAIIQYVGYSSKQFKDFKKGVVLPSQQFTIKLIKQILLDNPDTIFIVTRKAKDWKKLLGDVWDDNRFIVSINNRGQWLNEKVLKSDFQRVVDALKK